MNGSTLIPRLMLALLAILLATHVHAAKPVKAEKAVKAKQAQVNLREIEYPSLESKIGSELVIDGGWTAR